MAREKLKSFLNNINLQINPNEEGYPTGGTQRLNVYPENESGSPIETYSDDLTKDLLDFDNQKSVLTEYLNYISQPLNDFYQNPNPEEIFSYKRGDQIVTSETATNKVFAGQEAHAVMERSSSDYIKNKELYLDKTGENKSLSGHNLLERNRQAVGIDTQSTILQNNRFSDAFINSTHHITIADGTEINFSNIEKGEGYKFKESNSDIEDFENTNIGSESSKVEGSIQTNNIFGSYNDNASQVKFEKLKKIGASLLLKSSGFTHDAGYDGKFSYNNNILFDAMDQEDLESYILNEEEAVSKIKGNAYRAKFADGFPREDEDASEREINNSKRDNRGDFFNQNSDSFGQTYNSNYHFFGKNQKIHKAQCAIALQAVKTLISEVFGSLIGYFSDVSSNSELNFGSSNSYPKEESFDNSTHGPFLLGKARTHKNLFLDLIKEKHLVKTLHNYKDCIERGLIVCLGGNETNNSKINQAPGFWLSVSKSILKNFNFQVNTLLDLNESDGDEEDIRYRMQNLQSNPVLRFMNAMATVGDISYKAFNGKKSNEKIGNIKHPRDVDLLLDTPGNRVGKSRKRRGKNPNQLSIAHNDVPSSYILPMNVIRAASKLDTGPNSANPLRAMLGSELVNNTYFGLDLEGSGNRIPAAVVKNLEDRLDAEYVPLYIQDLRTNEIISFHAFLTNLSDTFNTTYDSSTGYGRMDSVHVFNKTSRSVQVDFKIVSTSKEDFNAMWYKVNKLMTLIYPQWTKGTEISPQKAPGDLFIQPFSQVIGATPVVRLRVGDIIKSNYSKFNLARIFGIGDQGVIVGTAEQELDLDGPNTALGHLGKPADFISEKGIEILVGLFGSVFQYTGLGQAETGATGLGADIQNFVANNRSNVESVLAEYMINGFVNPLTSVATMYQLQDPALEPADIPGITNSLSNLVDSGRFGYVPFTSILMLKGNNNTGYVFSDRSQRIYTRRPIKVMVIERSSISQPISSVTVNKKLTNINSKRTTYVCKIIDGSLATEDIFDKDIICSHSDLLPLPEAVFFNTFIASALYGAASFPSSTIGSIVDLASDFTNQVGFGGVVNDIASGFFGSAEYKFMDSEIGQNPYTEAYESNMGRGLAGVIQGLGFSWLDEEFTWETDYNSRAPKGCKISIKLDVIHDIPPGLDHAGYNRAPIYNVGDIMRNISGDVYDDFGELAEFKYRQGSVPTVKNTRD